VLSALEIYRFARMAGFSPDQAVTMTAVALAESGGNPGAHNPNGENSQGLWQINVAAHTDLAGTNLYDPLTNAQAAFRVSKQGQDMSPWTTTHGTDARYLNFRAEAEAAVRMAGENGTGVWTGTPGYGHPVAAGGSDGGGTSAITAAMTVPSTGGGATEQFVQAALAQEGDPYVWGVNADLGDADPDAFDCSELIEWAAAQAGVQMPDGSWYQYLELEARGTTMSVEEALQTRGALLFWFSSEPTADGGRPSEAHVAISLGDGRTIEARGTEYGVGSWTGSTERFNYAGVIPGLETAVPQVPAAAAAPATFAAVDTDKDGLVDDAERRIGSDPLSRDSDRDGSSDGHEQLRSHTSPINSDTDGDLIPDAVELVQGTDPTDPDSDRDGRVDGGDTSPDTDADGLSNLLEGILGTRKDSIDTDGDGGTDYLEYVSGLDPTDPLDGALRSSSMSVPAATLPGVAFDGAGPDDADGLGDT
jgi:cell wall-associated NlpC family hydrolase